MDGTSDDAEQILRMMKKTAAGFEGEYISGISLSCGIGAGNDAQDIEGIIRGADSNMYEQKRQYYIRSGTDRRRRRGPDTEKSGNTEE